MRLLSPKPKKWLAGRSRRWLWHRTGRLDHPAAVPDTGALATIQNALLRLAVPLFAIGTVFHGFEYLRYGRYEGGVPPVPPWAPGGSAGAAVAGLILIAAGLAIGFDLKRRFSAAVLAGFTLASLAVLHGPRIGAILADGTLRTRALEPLALAGAALALLADPEAPTGQAGNRAARFGRHLFAFCIVVFGVQHFLYLRFLASIVTSWIPGRVFWVVFIGLAFVAAGLAIASGRLARTAAAWLGVMFFLLFLLEHVPRVAAKPADGHGWDSMFMALWMSGASLLVARSIPESALRASRVATLESRVGLPETR